MENYTPLTIDVLPLGDLHGACLCLQYSK